MGFTTVNVNRDMFSRHLDSRMRSKKRAKKILGASLMLTPMVDMFSLLVIFLLQFFSGSPEFLTTQGIVLPKATSGMEVQQVPVVSVTMNEVWVERKRLATIDEVMKQPEVLGVALAAIRTDWMKKHKEEKFLGQVNLEAHEEIKSTVVSQIMAILAAQHYGSIQLLSYGDKS